MNAASPRQSLVKGERLTRYELAAVMSLQSGAGVTHQPGLSVAGAGALWSTVRPERQSTH